MLKRTLLSIILFIFVILSAVLAHAEHPEHLEVALTDDNFGVYFNVSFSIDDFYSFDSSVGGTPVQCFMGSCIFSCSAKTAYPFTGVTFTPSAAISADHAGITIDGPSFRPITLSSSGSAAAKADFEASHFSDTAYVTSASDLHLKDAGVTQVTGTVVLPWDEGCGWLYSQAEQHGHDGQFDHAVAIWQQLSDAGYQDAAARLAQSQAALNAAHENAYQTALQQLSGGEYDAAIATLHGLHYKDSDLLLSQAANGRLQAAYDAAAALEAEGKYLEAKEAFEAIRTFSNAATRALACADAHRNLSEPAYQNAVALMKEKKYDEAIAIFQTLDDYQDSAQKIEECRFSKTYDEAQSLEAANRLEEAITLYESLFLADDAARCTAAIPERDYAAAMALYNSKAFAEAEAAFKALGSYKDAAAMAAKCPDELFYQQAMDAYNAGDYLRAYPLLAQIYKDARVKPLLTLDPKMPVNQLGALLQNDNIVWFGPTAWFVIDHNNGKTMLFTVDSIGDRVFRTEQSRPTWQNSDIRKWLNNTYYKKFTADEQKLILTSTIKNPKYPVKKNTVPAGGNTQDKLFLLNFQEAEKLSEKVLTSVKGSWWLRTNCNHNSFDQTWPWWDILVCGGLYKGEVSIYSYDYCHGDRPTRAAMWVNVGYKSLASGSKGDAVLNLETRLQQGGFFTDVPDQQYNNKTAAAVKAAQEVLGLKKTGSADYTFLYLLDAYIAKQSLNQ